MTEVLKVVITGHTGLIGGALAESLEADGHRVVGVSRRPGATVTWDPAAGTIDADALEGADAVVHLAGETIEGRWTAKKKQRILNSRVAGTELLATTIAGLDDPPRVVVSGSAMGAYGSRGDELLPETASRGEGFLADVVDAWESAARPIAAHARLAYARTSLVLSPDGGALEKMATITRLGGGGPLGDGRQFWSWITLDDEVRALRHLIEAEVEGPVNLATPNPVRQREFADTLAAVLHRPSFLPAPKFAIRAALGEMGQALLLDSARLVPEVLAGTGFEWRSPELAPALAELFA